MNHCGNRMYAMLCMCVCACVFMLGKVYVACCMLHVRCIMICFYVAPTDMDHGQHEISCSEQTSTVVTARSEGQRGLRVRGLWSGLTSPPALQVIHPEHDEIACQEMVFVSSFEWHPTNRFLKDLVWCHLILSERATSSSSDCVNRLSL